MRDLKIGKSRSSEASEYSKIGRSSSGLLHMHHYKNGISKDVINLVVDLESELEKFQNFCLSCNRKSEVDELKNDLINKYSLDFEFAGFYYRELDPLSKKFNGDFSSLALLRFQNALTEFYCDYFLIIDDPKEFRKKIIDHSLSLSDSYVMRSFYILFGGYGMALPLATLACHLINPVESILDKDKVTTIKQLKISKALKSLMGKKQMALTSTFLFEIVVDAASSWEREHKSWVQDIIFKDKRWKFYTNYKNGSDCQYVGGLFNLRFWGNGIDFPKGHRFANNKLPILKHKKQWTTVRPDCLLSFIGESIGFSSIVENHIRDKLELPRLGEGQWIGEVSLLNKIKTLTTQKVVHQWSPDWLGRQRVDVGVPDLGLAFEYNGLQHYEAVDFFGGEEGLKNTKKRDALKKQLCKKNKVKLFEIKHDMQEEEVDSLLRDIFKTNKS